MSFRPAGFYDGGDDEGDDEGCGFDFGDNYDSSKLICDDVTVDPRQDTKEGEEDEEEEEGQYDDYPMGRSSPSVKVIMREEGGEMSKERSRRSSECGEDPCGITMETKTDNEIIAPVDDNGMTETELVVGVVKDSCLVSSIKSGETSPASDQSDCSNSSLLRGNDRKRKESPVKFKISSDDEPGGGEEKNDGGYGNSINQGRGFPLSRKGSGRSQDVNMRSTSRAKLLEIGESLKVAITRGNLEQVGKILDEGFDPNAPLNSGWPPLLHACDSCQDSIVRHLLGRGVSADSSRDFLTALMVVCMNKKPSLREQAERCARLLLDHGAKVNSCDRHRMNPLLYACQTSQTGLAKMLISSNAEVNSSDVKGWTPLFFAASKGHTSLLQILVVAGSNPKIVCSQGETPFTVAYSGGHKAAADWLESITSKGRDGSLDLFLPTTNTSDTPSRHTLTSTEPDSSNLHGDRITKVGCVLGDLEMFLMGLQLKELIPIFHDHKVEFGQLLSMTDFDLQLMGVAQVGARKKILSGVLEVHKKEWTMPEAALPYSRPISSAELTVIVTNLARHALYLRGSAHFLLTHVRSDLDLLGPHVEPGEVKKLSSGLSEIVDASRTLRNEVEELKNLTLSNLCLQSSDSKDSSSTLLPRSRGPLVLKAILGVGTLSCLTFGLYHILKQH